MNGTVFGETKVFYSPNKVVFGLYTAKEVASEVRALGGTKTLIVTDKAMLEMDLIRPVVESLGEASIPYVIYDAVIPDAPARLMVDALKQFTSEGCDMIVGFGGGSSLDTAKGVSLMATNGDSIQDMIGLNRVRRRGVPKVLLPTTNVAGAETGYAIVTVTDEEKGVHEAIVSVHAMPDVAIVDPILTLTMPPSVTADTGLDVLVTGIECYVSATKTPFSDLLAEKIISLCARYLPVAWAKGTNLEARYHMSLAATLSGPAYMSSGLGAVHGLSYPIATACNLSHGNSMAVILPSVMRFNLQGNPERFARIAGLMGRNVEGLSALEAAPQAVEAVEDLLEAIAASHRLRDYGISEEDIPKLAQEGMHKSKEVFLPPNPRDFTVKNLEDILKSAL